jgi:hypothetical protein
MKNRIINGAMVIDQRNAGASLTVTANGYSLDRWQTTASQSSKYSVQQNAGSVTPPVGFKNYLGVTSLSAYSLGAGDYFSIAQRIEGFNTADLDFGTANAKTFTLSFWVRSSLTGTFGGAFSNSSYARSYPYTYTISLANTWEYKTVTVAGDTTGTWVGATNGIGLIVEFGLGVGTTYSGTAGAWASGGGFDSATGATSVVGTNGATFYITGVQLEVGSSATGFEYRQYGTELSLCQRYYETAGQGILGLTNSATGIVFGYSFQVVKRASPTLNIINASQTWPFIGTATYTSSSVSVGDAGIVSASGTSPRIEGFSGMGTSKSVICYTANAFSFSAEL